MIEAGLLEEVQQLLGWGYDWSLPAMSAVGYAEFQPYFESRSRKLVEERHPQPVEGEVTLDDVIGEIESSLHRFIRHQYNWFALDDPGIHWFDVSLATQGEIRAVVRRWLQKHYPRKFASLAP
jgi:tRNA A37 N6-isopentenylltransferase MiaA